MKIVAKRVVKMSSEWLDRMNTQDYSKTDNLVIGTPIEQTFVSSGSKTNAGVYEVRNLKKYSQSVSEFRAMALGNRYKTPPYDNYDDLEKKYWKSICYIPPIYGADVNGSLFGEEIDCWNIAKLDSVLDLIGMDNGLFRVSFANPLYLWPSVRPYLHRFISRTNFPHTLFSCVKIKDIKINVLFLNKHFWTKISFDIADMISVFR